MQKLTHLTTLLIGCAAAGAASFTFIEAQPAKAGDMGKADIENRNDISIQNAYSAHCTSVFDNHHNKADRCKLKFIDGYFKVDNSRGITKDQVIGFTYHLEANRKFFNVLYRTSDDQVSDAQFHFNHLERSKAFYNTFVLFMGGNLEDRLNFEVESPWG